VCVGAKSHQKEVCDIKAQVVIFTFNYYDNSGMSLSHKAISTLLCNFLIIHIG
jgi:hypothetical protein